MGPLREDFSLSSSALIGLLVIAVAIATVIVVSLVMLRKRQYGTISHGIVEVSSWAFFQLGPELASVCSLPFRALQMSSVCTSWVLHSNIITHWIIWSHFGSQPQLNYVDPVTQGHCQLLTLIWALT